MPAAAARLRWLHGLALALAAALLARGLYQLTTAPQLTVTNTALVIAWPGRHTIDLALASASACLLAVYAGRRAPRFVRTIAWTLALGVTLLTAQHACLRVTLDNDGLARRDLLGSTRLAWRDVTRVTTGSAALVAWAGDRQVRVDTGALAAELRATVERNVARHVREARTATPSATR